MRSINSHKQKKLKVRVILVTLMAIFLSFFFIVNAIAESGVLASGSKLGIKIVNFDSYIGNDAGVGSNIGIRLRSDTQLAPDNPEYDITIEKDSESTSTASASPTKYNYVREDQADESVWPMKIKLESTHVKGWSQPEWKCISHSSDQVSFDDPNIANPTATVQAGVAGTIKFSVRYKVMSHYKIEAVAGNNASKANVVAPSPAEYGYSPSNAVTVVLDAAAKTTGFGPESISWHITLNDKTAPQDRVSTPVYQESGVNAGKYVATIYPDTEGAVVFTANFPTPQTYRVTAERGVGAGSVTATPDSYEGNPTLTRSVSLTAAPATGYTGEPTWEVLVGGVPNDKVSTPVKNGNGYTSTIEPGVYGAISYRATFADKAAYDIKATAKSDEDHNAASADILAPDTKKYTYHATDDTEVTITAEPMAGYTYDATWEIIFAGKTITEDSDYRPADGATGAPATGSSSTVKAALHSPVVSYPVPAKDSEGNVISGQWKATIQAGITGTVEFVPVFKTGAPYNITAAPATDTSIGNYDPNVDSAKIIAVNDVEVADSAAAVYAYSTTASTKVELTADP
ncbi:hypothetical protein, partial [Adlercreutzia murintestinalis]|uniref:hypothetical protein n=1 Tax=Adlercreutzia murintestinalis TaxID=2941325 RepID=UPI00203AB9FC